ncbi:hypothetical protein DM02DRAFT_673242 [Periconia macrospinosa]|uniref:Uncharacterized protein n=1 Tax=Periconia macrospinosa TaxID=97972 RepID=A0A2V1DK94_9PLEO|nr:hypothetical protein DM02DRAFT_673242 [Periconia macrospinosa]
MSESQSTVPDDSLYDYLIFPKEEDLDGTGIMNPLPSEQNDEETKESPNVLPAGIDFQLEPGDKEIENPHKQTVMPQEEEHKSNRCEVAEQAIKEANEIRDSAHKLKADQEKMWERLTKFDCELEKLKKKLISSEQSKPAVGRTSRKRKASQETDSPPKKSRKSMQS